MVALAPGASASGPTLPTGTVTFVFTDIEGSTELVQRIGDDRFKDVIETHDALFHEAFESHDGVVVRTEGDAFFVAFVDATAAIRGVVAAQRAIAAHDWGDAGFRVRMGVHTGDGRLGGDNYIGFDVHRAARIAAVGWGGQVVVSSATVAAVGHLEGIGFRDLGLHRLKDLSAPERLHQLLADGLADSFPELRSLDVSPHRLPNPVSSFIGRATEVDLVSRLVTGGHRLVTLTGPGGTGKTRLAIAVAHQVADRFPDGACFVPLGPVSEPELVPAAIIEAMGARRPSTGVDPAVHVATLLAGHRVLLVLDNVEHLLSATPLVSDLLSASPGVHVLATSRAPLRLDGEHEIHVQPLLVPDRRSANAADYPSVALFLDRAALPRVGQPLTEDDTAAITELVRRLDGLPLAIEIAAARARTIPPAMILERLGTALTSDRRDLPPRQRTLDATIRWSYDLLAEPDRDLFERLGAFAGSVGLDEVEPMAGSDVNVWDSLEHLVDQSLVWRGDSRGVPRFRMLETIRSFAAERLAERPDCDELRDRHVEIFVAFAEEAATHLKSAQRAVWLDRMEDDHGNLLAALDRAVSTGAAEPALRIVSATWRFWQMRGHLRHALEHVEDALAVPGASGRPLTNALRAAGGIAYWRGDVEGQLAYYRRAVEAARGTGDERLLADTLYDSFYSIASHDGFDAAAAILDEAEGIYRGLDYQKGLGLIAWAWGSAWQMKNDFEAAAENCRKSLEFFDPVDDSFDRGWAEFMYADNLIRLGRPDEGESHLRAGLDSFVEAGDQSAFTLFLVMFARLALERGHEERAIQLTAAASRISKDSGAGMMDTDPRIVDRYPRGPIEKMRPELQAAHAAGWEMSVEEALALATGAAPA